ncbi:ESPR-type extended signal peptide-containing protein, partial [Burkholderia cepacia]|uniref:ESPR-type extended signal peptide-containing protein n=1 Tax=Burkholderia cepacia TaxID=292 RepID=UPI0039BFD1B3
MNKIYRSIWNDALGVWVAASELTNARGKASKSIFEHGSMNSSGQSVFGVPTTRLRQGVLEFLAVAGILTTGVLHNVAWASDIGLCNGNSAITYGINGSQSVWTSANWTGSEGNCGTGIGVIIAEAPSANGGVTGNSAYMWVGGTGNNPAGAITLYGPSGITLNAGSSGTINLKNTTSLNNNKITNLAPGTNPTDAVNFSQLTSLSTSTSTGLSSANSSIGSLSTSTSTGLSSANSSITSLSTSTSTGLSSANSSISSLSTSTSTGISSLSTGLSSTNSSVSSLSTSTSTGLSSANSSISSLSTSTSTGLSSAN